MNINAYSHPRSIIPIKNANSTLQFSKIFLSKDTVSFKNKSLNPYWGDFNDKIKEKYKNKPLDEVLALAISKPENKLGEGAKKIVYSIDGIEDYVVAFMKEEEYNSSKPCVSCVDNYPDCNLGQAIGRNYAGFSIMKKIEGQNHGIADWTSKYHGYVFENRQISKQDAQIFLKQLENLSALPFEAYIELAHEIKYLTDKKIKIDMINPNNLMVDNEKGKMTYFDLFEKPEVFYPILPEINSSLDMAYLLVDPLLQSEYLKALEPQEQAEMIELTKNIIKKSKEAGAIVGLIADEHIVSVTYALLQGRLTVKSYGQSPMYLECYNEFRKIYKDII